MYELSKVGGHGLQQKEVVVGAALQALLTTYRLTACASRDARPSSSPSSPSSASSSS